jgi:ankyrin repeat protein
MEASAGGHLETVQALLDAGADPNAQRPNGATALELAVQAGHQAIADLLATATSIPATN